MREWWVRGMGGGDGCNRKGELMSERGELDRRSFLKAAGVVLGASIPLGGRGAFAGPFEAGGEWDHFVPVDKKLGSGWLAGLVERGERTWYGGGDLDTIGMPVGGICAGQVYLTGDGRLVYWDIFNQQHNSGYGAHNYAVGRGPETAASPQRLFPMAGVEQGMAVRVRRGSEAWTRPMDREGFSGVRFCGEYPIGRVDYGVSELPVGIVLEAFSPFIPLNADDSALPATYLEYTVENRSAEEVEVTLAGWLGNEVCRHSREQFAGRMKRVNRVMGGDGLVAVRCEAVLEERESSAPVREPIVFADFEGGDYGGWEVDGEAFGSAPAAGTLAGQNPVSGYVGEGLVNTFLGGDGPHGRLVSPEFTIEREWIGFLVGGGSHAGETCINLRVGDQVVRTMTGRDNERLEPANWHVGEWMGQRARIEIVDTASGGWGHINIDHIEFRDEPLAGDPGRLQEQPDFGTLVLAVLDAGGAFARPGMDREALEGLGPDVFRGGEEGIREASAPGMGAAPLACVGRTVTVPPGESKTVTFVVAWHMPNLRRDARRVGQRYAVRFRDALDVASYLAANRERLVRETRLWHDTYYDSSLPYWLLDRMHSTLCNLASATCQWWEDGRFWGWEGCGCCHGTCGHVWNYAHGLARLFPSLERSVREMQDFRPGVGLHEDGSIAFRGEGWGMWAGDSQGGYILKAYREHLCSPDDAFLKRNWPRIRLAMDFLLREDGNDDGLLEKRQHQTYDQDYFGANTMVGSMYLGALRAAEEMARAVGDTAYADRCRRVFEAGSALSSQRLFNGEYYIQDVDLEAHPEWQYADGCLADQLFGQSWAHHVGLGHLYSEQEVRSALRAIWTYCWAPDIGAQNRVHKPERWFAYPGEAGLFTCTWPKRMHLGPKSTRYRNEVWTGIEYQVAGHMIWEGMLTEGLAICRAVHDRYHPAKHNPWNEIECGDHYARALASWGVLTALCGFTYHGPAGRIGIAPRLNPEDFRGAFTAAEGWGTAEQRRTPNTQVNRLVLRWGRLPLRQVVQTLPEGARATAARVAMDGREIPARWTQQGGEVTVEFDETVIRAGETMEIVATIS